MIRTEQQGLHQSLLTAIETNKETIVSAVKKVEWLDPLLFYAAGQQLNYTERFYWSDPAQDVVLAGVGTAFTIADGSRNRFENAGNVWNNLLDKMIVQRPSYQFGTGPLLFGGFTFDPLQKKTGLWSRFSDTTLWLPSFMITLKDGETWLTVNHLVKQGDDAQTVYNHLTEIENQLIQYSKYPLSEQVPSSFMEYEVDPGGWIKSIEAVQEEMKHGHIQKVVLARELQLTGEQELDSTTILEALRIGQPDCYVFALDYKGACFLGATPERLIRKENNLFTSMCLAGSIGRGETLEEDRYNSERLLQDEKNLVEHGYVVEMIRDIMNELCEQVNIPHKPALMKTKHLLHLYTPVEARGTCNLLKMVEKLHPTPALGGTPREEALALIRKYELLDRGLYAGPIGWIDYEGNGEFAVGIRSGLLKGAHISLFAGCGIVADSDPALEYEETKMKFKPMLTALGGNME